MTKTWFVAGAGTDIGKTHVACGLLRAARAQGLRIGAFKPVVSGFNDAAPQGSDPYRLLEALGQAPTSEAIAEISPWRYAAPLAPNMAAREEGRVVDFGAVRDACLHRAAGSEGGLLIEGAGGVMSPLSDNSTMLDLMVALGVPALLVGGTYLGAISHTLTALAAVRARGIAVPVVVISESEGGVDMHETLAAVSRFGDAAVWPAPREPQAFTEGMEALAASLWGRPGAGG